MYRDNGLAPISTEIGWIVIWRIEAEAFVSVWYGWQFFKAFRAYLKIKRELREYAKQKKGGTGTCVTIRRGNLGEAEEIAKTWLLEKYTSIELVTRRTNGYERR